MEVSVKVCDIEKAAGLPVTSVEIRMNGETVKMDLCDTHLRPIVQLVQRAQGEGSTSLRTRRYSARGRLQKVTTVEEIERLKRA